MAKSISTGGMPEKEKKYSFPSRFGSHSSMIDAEETEKLGDPSRVVLKDEHGTYITERSKLDCGLSDPNRYPLDRLKKLFDEKKAVRT